MRTWYLTRTPLPKLVRSASVDGQSVWPFAVAVILLVVHWGYAKFSLFSRLAYTSDLFTFLQMSYSWLFDKPLLFENQYGLHARVHNYYIAPFFAPLTVPFGAYGLLIGHLALFLSAALYLLAILKERRQLAHSGPLLLVLLFGPVSFWIWDDPIYGFHLEFVLLPLAILYAIGLIYDLRWRWAVLVLICLTREEGAVVGCCVHLCHLIISSGLPLLSRLFLNRAALAVAGYTAVFAIGIAWLMWQSQNEPTRLGISLGEFMAILDSPAWISALRSAFLSWIILAISPMMVAVYMRPSAHTALAIAIASVPLLITGTVGTLAYGPDAGVYHGLAWPPRFALTWATTLSVCIFLATQSPPTGRFRLVIAVLFAVSLVILQTHGLTFARSYDYFDRLLGEPSQSLLYDRFSAAEKRLTGCLGQRLPKSARVASQGDLFGLFHRQWVVWPDRAHNAAEPIDVIVCDTAARANFEYGCGATAAAHRPRMFESKSDGLRIQTIPALVPILQSCLAAQHKP